MDHLVDREPCRCIFPMQGGGRGDRLGTPSPGGRKPDTLRRARASGACSARNVSMSCSRNIGIPNCSSSGDGRGAILLAAFARQRSINSSRFVSRNSWIMIAAFASAPAMAGTGIQLRTAADTCMCAFAHSMADSGARRFRQAEMKEAPRKGLLDETWRPDYCGAEVIRRLVFVVSQSETTILQSLQSRRAIAWASALVAPRPALENLQEAA